MRNNKQMFAGLDDALRLLIFIEIVNTIKVLIMQNFQFLRGSSKKYHNLIAYCLKELQTVLRVDIQAVLNKILLEYDKT